MKIVYNKFIFDNQVNFHLRLMLKIQKNCTWKVLTESSIEKKIMFLIYKIMQLSFPITARPKAKL